MCAAVFHERFARWFAVLAAPLPVAAAVAGAGSAGAASAGIAPSSVAVVSVSGRLPVTAPGVRVLAVLPHVGAEVVRASRVGLAALAADRRVTGLAGDWRLTVDSVGTPPAGSTGVFASQALAGPAGTPAAGRGVNVALVDTGVTDTPALNRASGRITDGVDTSALDSGGPALTSGTFSDGYGHGTFLASLIAGAADPGSRGVPIGVAPAARIVVVKVADAQGDTSLVNVLAGLDWVAAHARAIQVANIALSVQRPTAPLYGADPLTAAVEHVRAAGVAVVAAVGNTPGEVGDPGLDPFVLSVGAADTTSGAPVAAPFSGYGNVDGVSRPDVVAAGVNVLGEMPPDAVIAQQHPSGWQPDGLFRGSGTSEATAITSGTVAIYDSLHPGRDPGAVKSAVLSAAQPIGGGTPTGAGLLRMPRDPNPGPDTSTNGFDASSWSANAWLGGAWASWLASSWSGPAWDASSWSASSWSASSWSASSWSDAAWNASSWSASSWSASSWSASSWSASSWSDAAWGADRT